MDAVVDTSKSTIFDGDFHLMLDNTMKIIIVGAGLGGLGAAFCFARRGYEIVVLEQQQGLSSRGGSLSTRPGASRILQSWGLEDDLDIIANKTSKIILRNLETGKICGQSMAAGDESKFIHWGTTREELIGMFYRKSCEAGVSVRFGTVVQDVREDNAYAYAVLDDGSTVQGDLMLIADGIRSRLRSRILDNFGSSIQPIISDITAYGFKLSTGSLMIDPKDTACLMEELCSNIWIGNDVFAVTRFNKKGGYVHFLYHTRRSNPDQRALWDEHGDIEHIRAAFSQSCCAIVTAANKASSCDRWRLAELPALPSHISKGGRLVLLGDSAHAMHPSAGQGFSQIIEDIAVLDELIMRSPRPNKDLSQITRHWQAIRKPRVERIQEYSRWNTGNISKAPLKPTGEKKQTKEFHDVVGNMNADFGTFEFLKWALDYDPEKEVDQYLAGLEDIHS